MKYIFQKIIKLSYAEKSFKKAIKEMHEMEAKVSNFKEKTKNNEIIM